MVLEHMGTDVTATVDLRLGMECWGGQQLSAVSFWDDLRPTPFCCCLPDSKTDTPSSPEGFHSPDKAGSRSGPIQGQDVLPPNGDTRVVVSRHKARPELGDTESARNSISLLCVSTPHAPTWGHIRARGGRHGLLPEP